MLRSWLQRNNTRLRREISVEAQASAYLYYISDEGRYRKTANAFGVSHALISTIIGRALHAVTYDLSWTTAYKITKDRDDSKRTG